MATEPIATFSGLASGIQWRDLIDQLMQVERRPAALIESQITGIQSRSSAWQTFQGHLTSFQDAVAGLSDGSSFGSFTTSVSGSGFKTSATSDAVPGSYSVEVLALAQAEKLGSDIVSSSSDALGFSGEFWINGVRVEVDAADSLTNVASTINSANTGSTATGVSASVVSNGSGYQLVLSSKTTGATGIDLADGSGGALASLGFTDGTTSIKHTTSSGARSDAFSSKTTAVSTLRDLTSGATSDTVTIGPPGNTFTVAVDLTKSLTDIAADIQAAATAAASSVTASVVSETSNGVTTYRLDIQGTTAFQDASGMLGTLGVLEGGRGTVAQELTGATALGGGAATAATSLDGLDGAQIGDTFTVTGTNPDGTTFSQTLTVAAVGDPDNGDVATLQDVLDALEGVNGFNGAATATIVGGQLVVTDASGGSSQLALSIVANNEGGGTLDFGAFDTTAVGRSREIVSGADAAVRIDGVYSTSTTNSISDAMPGVNLTLTSVSGSAGVVTVARNTDDIASSVQAMVDAYNTAAAFVSDQFQGGESSTKPLRGDSTLRGMLSTLRTTMQATLTTGVGGSWTRLADLGIEIQSDGTFSFDKTTLVDALTSDPSAAERMFAAYGTTSGAGLTFLDSTDATEAGSYTVAITTAAATASATGADLGGTWSAADDTLTITDLGSGKSYEIALVNGQSDATVLANIQAELETAKTHEITAATALESDAVGTAATESTTWDQIYQGGVSGGVQNGDSFTISGRRTDGATFYKTVTITDASTQTVGELKDAIQNAVGSGASVELGADGKFVITAASTGSSLLEVTLSADLDSGTLDLSSSVTQEGRPQAPITASLEGGALKLVHDDYGSSAGFRIEFLNAGTEAVLGLGATGTEHTGTDVAGTIGGLAATGSGRTLTGADSTAVEGLSIQVDPAFTSGTVTFDRGIAARIASVLEPLLGTDDESIQAVIDGLDERVTGLNDRIDEIDARLERRRADLVRRFTAMEQAMASAQSRSNWLTSTINALPAAYSSSSN